MRDVVTEMSTGYAWIRIQQGFPYEDQDLAVDRRYQRSPALYRVEEEWRPPGPAVRGHRRPRKTLVQLAERLDRTRRAKVDHHRRHTKPRLQRQRRRGRVLKRVRWTAFRARQAALGVGEADCMNWGCKWRSYPRGVVIGRLTGAIEHAPGCPNLEAAPGGDEE